jgi:uncharacterized membrane protein YfcA
VNVGQLALLAVAGFAAGAVNAVAGGGSLLTFPALLAVGVPSVPANVTNLVALLPAYASGSGAYRRELTGQGRRIRDLGTTSALGAVAGAAILLVASQSAFRATVPFLILGACALLAAQRVLARAVARRHGNRHHGLHAAVLAATVYGGYFGAGLGIVLLAVLGAFLEDDLHRLNALKGVISLVVSVAAAVVVGIFGPVRWGLAVLIAVTGIAGAWLGVGLARRLDPEVLRWAVVAYGVVAAIWLLVT